MRSKLMLWGAVAAAALSSTAAMASVVVVKSLGPSSKAYPPGKTLPESAKITLQGGDVVTLLGPGSAQTLRGPGNFDAKQVTMASSAKRGRFGALRAAEVAQNPSIWDIDASQSGRMCVTDAGNLKLWRPEADGETTVEIRSGDGKSAKLTWATGKLLAPWPATLPVSDGAEYQIVWPGGEEPSKLDLVKVGAPPADLVQAAQVLIDKGCQNQLELLVDSASKVGK